MQLCRREEQRLWAKIRCHTFGFSAQRDMRSISVLLSMQAQLRDKGLACRGHLYQSVICSRATQAQNSGLGPVTQSVKSDAKTRLWHIINSGYQPGLLLGIDHTNKGQSHMKIGSGHRCSPGGTLQLQLV